MVVVEVYDNGDEPSPASAPGTVLVIDRVYWLDWPRFDDRDWDVLMSIFRSLPGWDDASTPPSWFGAGENADGYLDGSVEPPGLHVVGILASSTFLAWDTAFRTRAAALPSYDPR